MNARTPGRLNMLHMSRVDGTGIDSFKAFIIQDGRAAGCIYGFSENECNERGKYLVQACNSHDALVAALRGIIDSYQLIGGKETGALLAARAALAAIK